MGESQTSRRHPLDPLDAQEVAAAVRILRIRGPASASLRFVSVNLQEPPKAELQNGQQTYPGGFKGIDVCVFTHNCSGGSQALALAAGASDTFTLLITGGFTGHTVTLTPFPISFKTSDDTFRFAGDASGSSGGSGPVSA